MLQCFMVLLLYAVAVFMRMGWQYGPVIRGILVWGVMLLMMSLLQETWQFVMVLKF
jgi:hypothetical protein